MTKYEKGQLMGQKAKSTDFKGGLKELKVYSFRGFINLKPEAAHAVLDLVLDGKLMLTQMKKKAAEVYKLQQVQAALMGVVKEQSWLNMQQRFPNHTGSGTEQLSNMFANVSMYSFFNRFRTHTKI